MRPPLRSSPPSTPSPYRYLGRGGGERPVRVQIILALVAALVLVAVPLYLWRRPQPAGIPSADAATAPSALLPPPGAPGPGGAGAPGALLPGMDPLAAASSGALGGAAGALGGAAGVPQLVGAPTGPKVEVAPVKTLKCQDPGPGRTPPERCDGIRFFEDGLTRAIKDAAACAPASKNGYVVSFVLEMHFGKKRTNLFLGKSTNLPKSRRKELVRCVERALPTPDWDRIPHQHLKYTINTVATYPAATEADPGGGAAEPERDAPEKPKAAPKKKPSAPKKSAPSKKSP